MPSADKMRCAYALAFLVVCVPASKVWQTGDKKAPSLCSSYSSGQPTPANVADSNTGSCTLAGAPGVCSCYDVHDYLVGGKYEGIFDGKMSCQTTQLPASDVWASLRVVMSALGTLPADVEAAPWVITPMLSIARVARDLA